ncbi:MULTISPECIES: putative holin [Providencia]|uniref:putative holin n=1 Tax=Providencia TaxID=586 RepID=UPI001E444C29|nr:MULTISPECIES: putative holin [Providencia]URR22913.1 phage holin family protein [Providencia rettgeri]
MKDNAAAVTGLSLASFASFFSGLPPSVVMGAILGAIYFTTVATEFTFVKRSILAIISFAAGLLFFSPFATLFVSMTSLIGVRAEAYNIESLDALGAFIASLLSLKLSIKAYEKADIPKGGNSHDIR